MSEKRRAQRVRCCLPARMIKNGEASGVPILDMSPTGLFLATDEPIKLREMIELEIELPDCTVRMFATVRFVGETMRGRGLGAELFVMDPSDQLAWRRHYYRELERMQCDEDATL